jgi:hypothetical protein
MDEVSEVIVFNTSGQKIISKSDPTITDGNILIDVQKLASGFYWVEVVAEEKIFRSKFLKE